MAEGQLYNYRAMDKTKEGNVEHTEQEYDSPWFISMMSKDRPRML